MDKLSLELFSIFCLYSSIHYLVQSCYLIKLLLHYSLIPQWYYKNWFRYFCTFSILYISHRTGWRYQCIRDVATNKPILTLKSYQTKTSTLNLTSNVETEIPVQAFIRIKYCLRAHMRDLFWISYFVLERLLSSFALLPGIQARDL